MGFEQGRVLKVVLVVPVVLAGAACRLAENASDFSSAGPAAGAGATAGGSGTGGVGASGGASGAGAGGASGGNMGGTAGSAGSGGFPNECENGTCSAVCADCDGELENKCETNTQTDSAHCGAYGRSCLGGACESGRCQPIEVATEQAKPWGVEVYGATLFWTLEGPAGSDGSVVSQPIAGGTPNPIASDQVGPVSVRVDETHVYWTTFVGGSVVRRALKNGTSQEDLAGADAAWSLAIDDTDVFWTNLGGSVRKVSKSGGSPLMLSGESMPWDIGLDSADVYWTAKVGGEIRKAPRDLSTASTVLSNLRYPLGLLVTDDRVYWAEAGSLPTSASNACSDTDGAVFAADKDGKNIVKIADSQACPTRIAVIDDDIYWTNAGTTVGGSYQYNGAVMQAKIDGSGLRALAVSQVKPHGIVAVGDSVFWTTQGAVLGQGTVMRIVR